MKILYDQQIFSLQDYGGISRYFYELIKRLEKTNNQVLVDGKFSNNVYLPKLINGVKKNVLSFNFPYKNVILFYLNKFFDSKYLKNGEFDVLHATYYHPYFLCKLGEKPYVITVHDLTHELFKKKVGGMTNKTIEYKKKVLSNANHIIAVSKNTKKDLIRIYKISSNKISIVYHGNSFEDVMPKKVDNLPNKYLLFVGKRQGYKNFTLFVKAVAPILQKEKNLSLVCAGGGQFSREEKELFSDLKISSQVKQINFNLDGELAYIYKKALVYVLPSLYEGFGMTALEAFSMGCPVAASKTSSMPEVCGKAALYFNPKDKTSIRNVIFNLIEDSKERAKLISEGSAQVKKFSWSVTLKKTLTVYRKLI